MQEMDMSQSPSTNKNMMMIGGLVALVVVIGVGVVLAKNKSATTMKTASPSPVMSTQPTASAPSMKETASPTGTDTIMKAPTEARVISVEAGSFYYKPNAITVKKGETVKIVMTAKDMMHDFNIDELGVKLPMTRSGETNSVEFTATQVGTFEYYCSVGNHRRNGQVGALTVVE